MGPGRKRLAKFKLGRRKLPSESDLADFPAISPALVSPARSPLSLAFKKCWDLCPSHFRDFVAAHAGP